MLLGMTHEQMVAAVDAGEALLHEKVPGWWKEDHVDLDTLEMKSTDHCLLAQLAPFVVGDSGGEGSPWSSVAYRLGIRQETAQHGFDLALGQGVHFADLDLEWRNRILRLRQEGKEGE